MNLDNIKRALTRKLGPLPFWVWAVIGGGALFWYRQHAGGGQVASQSAQQTPDTAYYGPYGEDSSGIGGGNGSGGSDPGSSNTPSNNAPEPPTINVFPPSSTANGNVRRSRKHRPKPQHHKKKEHAKPTHPKQKQKPRSHATVQPSRSRAKVTKKPQKKHRKQRAHR